MKLKPLFDRVVVKPIKEKTEKIISNVCALLTISCEEFAEDLIKDVKIKIDKAREDMSMLIEKIKLIDSKS